MAHPVRHPAPPYPRPVHPEAVFPGQRDPRPVPPEPALPAHADARRTHRRSRSAPLPMFPAALAAGALGAALIGGGVAPTVSLADTAGKGAPTAQTSAVLPPVLPATGSVSTRSGDAISDIWPRGLLTT